MPAVRSFFCVCDFNRSALCRCFNLIQSFTHLHHAIFIIGMHGNYIFWIPHISMCKMYVARERSSYTTIHVLWVSLAMLCARSGRNVIIQYMFPLKSVFIKRLWKRFWLPMQILSFGVDHRLAIQPTDRGREEKKMVKMDKMLISKPLVHINLLAHLKWKRRVFALSLGSAICRFALDFILFLSGIQLKRYILAAATRSNMYTSNQHQFWIFALKTDLH